MTELQLNISRLNVFDNFFLDRQNSLTFTNLSFKFSKEPDPMILIVEKLKKDPTRHAELVSASRFRF
jgi:hypothetical protein